MRKYKWGILTAGKMSAKFVKALKLLENADLYAVGARDEQKAKQFAEEYGFKRFFGSYEELATDPEVDIIYIASPHSLHYEHTMLCLRNKKAVLCEKAFSLNSREAEAMIAESKKQGVFLMEALWPPFQPIYRKTREILTSGNAGSLLHLDARFGFQPPYDPADRKFNLSLGGGSLLDIGIYPVNDVLYFMGVPDEVTASASFTESGAEHTISIIFGFRDGRKATVFSSFRALAGISCTLYCEKGNIVFSRARDMSQRLSVSLNGFEPEEFSMIPEGMGYQYEADEVMKCLDEGRIESPHVTHSYTLNLMKTLDRVRKGAGIVFPGRD
jgi:predicted dehydrogenase